MSATATRSAPRVYKPHEWEEKRTAFEELYSQDKTLAQVKQLMGQNHNFYATEAQYKKKIKAWGLEKNIDKETALGILRKENKRKYVEGKDTKFTYKGNELNENRIALLRKRHKGLDHEDLGTDPRQWEMVQADTPLYVSYSTPPCISHSPPAPVDEPPEVEYAITDHPTQDTQVTDNEGIPGGECIMDDVSLITNGMHTAGLGQDISTRPYWDGLEFEKVLDNETQHNDSAEATPPNQQLQSQRPFGRSSPIQSAEPQEPVEIQISSKGDYSSYSDSILELEGSDTIRVLLAEHSEESMMDISRNTKEESSLYQALLTGDEEKFASLLKKGHDTSASNEYGWTALLLAVELGHENTIRLLLEGGIDLSVERYIGGKTALHLAAERGHEKISQLLLESGIDVSVKTLADEKTALHLAVERGHQKIVQLLLENDIDISAKDSCGRTALHIVVERDIGRVVQPLLKGGPDIPNFYLKRSLNMAAKRGHDGLVQLLLKGGVDISAKNPYSNMSLHLAAMHGHERVVQLLLNAGIDISVKSVYGETALHLAARHGHEGIVQLLLNAGIDISVKSVYEETALHLAVRYGHEGIVQLLLENGTDISAKTQYYKQTALHVAAESGHEKVVQLLLNAGIDISEKDSSGRTALHRAARHGHEAVVQLLLKGGIDISAKDSDGKIALHLAAEHGHEWVVQLLLENGIDISAKTL